MDKIVSRTGITSSIPGSVEQSVSAVAPPLCVDTRRYALQTWHSKVTEGPLNKHIVSFCFSFSVLYFYFTCKPVKRIICMGSSFMMIWSFVRVCLWVCERACLTYKNVSKWPDRCFCSASFKSETTCVASLLSAEELGSIHLQVSLFISTKSAVPLFFTSWIWKCVRPSPSLQCVTLSLLCLWFPCRSLARDCFNLRSFCSFV